MAAVSHLTAAPQTGHASLNPFRITGTELPANVLLMAKLLVICFLVNLHWRELPDRFLPFLPILEHAGSPMLFKRVLQAAFLIGAAGVLFNYRVRAGCLLLATVIFAGVLSSRPFFENNRVYAGCLWLLAGLQPSGKEPWPLRLQVSLLYFGAGLDKLLEPDWRTGQFFENMLTTFGHAHSYAHFSSWFPHLWLSSALGWIVITVELTLSTGFLIRPLWAPVACIGIAFHTALLLGAGKTFGMFYFAALAAFLVFASWPPLPMEICWPGDSQWKSIFACLRKLDFDHLFVISRQQGDDPDSGRTGPASWSALRLRAGDKEYAGLWAAYMTWIYMPATYFSCAIFLSLPFAFLTPVRLAVSVLFLLFMAPALLPPMARAWRRDQSAGSLVFARRQI